MKYIRTKDGKIISYTPKEKFKNDKDILNWFISNYCGGHHNIVGIADTIEELCDEFVLRFPDDSYCLMEDKNEIKNAERICIDLWCQDYGAIWTDKGLIYVAKTNKKGELELL